MTDEHILKGAFEETKFGSGKYGEFSAASKVDQTSVTYMIWRQLTSQ